MDDKAITAALEEVGAAWLMDEGDEYCQARAIRHVVACAVAAERERCAKVCESVASSLESAEEDAQAMSTGAQSCADQIRAGWGA